MTRRTSVRSLFALSSLLFALCSLPFALCSLPSALSAQTLDRSKIPPIGATPDLRVPIWTRSALANGADLIVSEKHDLPLVSFSISFLGGADQYEPAGKRGLAGLTSSMLSEGTRTRDGEALSSALQQLGTNVTVSVGGESGSIGFSSTTGKLAATLDVLADMLVNSTFPAASLERLRAQRLVILNQAKAQSGSIAGRVFPRVVYGDAHPYGQSTTEATIAAITREDVTAFHQMYFKPGRAVITVVGDVTPAAIKPVVERGLAGWTAGGERPGFSYPPVPALRPTTIYLVDKPDAAQSTFTIGLPGPPRNTPDYYALQVMNTMLGGMFASRLNANIREDKGYSYGVGSGFSYGKGPGAFRASGDIVSAKTDAGLIEFMKELRGILGARPITADEMKVAREALVQRLPGTFASVGAINNSLTGLWLQGLPDDYYQQYSKAIAAVSSDDVVRVAKKYIDLEHLAIVVVGDRKTVEGPLKATGVAPLVLLDIEGNIVSR